MSKTLRQRLSRVGSVAARVIAPIVLLVLLAAMASLLRALQPSGGPLTGALPKPGAGGFGATTTVAYALGSPSAEGGGLVAIELPSGQVLGRFADIRRQGGGLAFAPDGQRAYLLDGPYLHELELPSLRRLGGAELPDAISPMGHARVLAVSPDGREVYVQAVRYLDHQRQAPDGMSSQPDSEDSLAVYDVARGAFTRRIPLMAGGCGLSEIYVRPDGRLVVLCPFISQVRLVDPKLGRQIGTIEDAVGSMSALTIDGRRLLVVDRGGSMQEIDLDRQTVARRVQLAPAGGGCAPCVPYQLLHLSADGTRLFVRAAPGRPDLPSTGHGSVVWVINTTTLQRIAEVPLPAAPAFDAAPLPDGRSLLASNTNTQAEDERGSWLIEVPSGRELARWPGGLVAIEVRSLPASVAGPQPAAPRAPLAVPATATPRTAPRFGRIAFLRTGDVWVKDLPDGQERQLTRDGLNAQPRWSASREWLAFTRASPAGADTSGESRRELWVVGADAGGAHRLDSGPVGQVRWSPVADRLAFGTPNGAVVTDADGSNRHDLPSADFGAWSPDGAWLAYTRIDLLAPGTGGDPPQRRASLWVVRADGSEARKLLDAGTPSDQGFLVADWSPDAQYVLYWTDPGFSASLLADGTELMAVPVAGGQPVQVVDKTLVYRDGFQWSADGSRLVVVEGGLRMAWENKAIAVTTIGGSLRRLSDPARADVHPAWSPDGRWIAYSSGPAAPGVGGGDDARRALAQRRIWVMQADGSAKRQLTNTDKRDEWPRWSADGSHIVFVRLADERAQLWLMRTDGADARLVVDDLTNAATSTTQPPLWFGFYGSTDWSRLFDWMD